MSIQSVDFDQRNPSSVVHAAHESKAYLAGIVFTSAAIEYILAAWLRAFDILKFAKHKKKLTEHWSLKELNDLEPASITAEQPLVYRSRIMRIRSNETEISHGKRWRDLF
jgi:hypothetical protein